MSPRGRTAAASEDPQWRKLPLDNLTLTKKEGFGSFAEAPAAAHPEAHTRAQLKGLGEQALACYNDDRNRWHANMKPVRTKEVDLLHEHLNEIFNASLRQGRQQAKSAAAIDAFPGLGKTTAALAFAKDVHNRLIAKDGRFTAAGHERWPVCRVGMTGDTRMKDFNWALLEFFAHAGRNSGTANMFAYQALDCVTSCETKLIIVDDLQFLHFQSKSGTELSNHFKFIANEFPVMLLFIGHDLRGKGLYLDHQLERRVTPLGLEPFRIEDEQGRLQWRSLLLALEQRLVRAEKYPGMLADDLFARTTGHIGSLMTLLMRACERAIRTGEERVTRELLSRIRLDAAAERLRAEWEVALQSGTKTSRPARLKGTAT
ncbi:TniB family NTP-binding protein [Streptomyces sp. NPDC058122]|uniref:TniB family NTP-binding protein n=1 Tax=Streptomyces sp. NPDC058122 TaxID=3346349 RepID=UPI0036EBB287